jgi:hemerythrin-like domain-containing protein
MHFRSDRFVQEILMTNMDIKLGLAGYAGMRRHFAMEEEVLFPAFDAMSGMGGGGPTAMMRMEHQQMRGLLDQIGEAMEAGDAQEAMDIGDTLLMMTQQHNVKEEGMLYPMAENMLAGNWATLAAELEKY